MDILGRPSADDRKAIRWCIGY